MAESEWKTEHLAKTYLQGMRAAIPAAGLQLEIIIKLIHMWFPKPKNGLDLGCGDGTLGRMIMNKIPSAQLMFVYFSLPMLNALKNQLNVVEDARIIQADFSSSKWLNSLPKMTFDIIVSGFAIHHLTDIRKKELYKELQDLLNNSGLFLNLEHVSSATSEIEKVHDDFFIDYIQLFQNQIGQNNTRETIENAYYHRPDKKENILSSVENQCAWLRDIGFIDVDCFFKLFELAIFGGRKKEK